MSCAGIHRQGVASGQSPVKNRSDKNGRKFCRADLIYHSSHQADHYIRSAIPHTHEDLDSRTLLQIWPPLLPRPARPLVKPHLKSPKQPSEIRHCGRVQRGIQSFTCVRYSYSRSNHSSDSQYRSYWASCQVHLASQAGTSVASPHLQHHKQRSP
jgi:hypothetical protein